MERSREFIFVAALCIIYLVISAIYVGEGHRRTNGDTKTPSVKDLSAFSDVGKQSHGVNDQRGTANIGQTIEASDGYGSSLESRYSVKASDDNGLNGLASKGERAPTNTNLAIEASNTTRQRFRKEAVLEDTTAYNMNYFERDYYSENNNTGQDSYLTLAVSKGFQHQSQFCDQYCNGSAVVSNSSDVCYYSELRCAACYCDEVCSYYGDCCPSLDEGSRPPVSTDPPKVCVEILFGFEIISVEVIAGYPIIKASREKDSAPTSKLEADYAGCCESDTSPAFSLATGVMYCDSDCGVLNGETESRLATLDKVTCLDTRESLPYMNRKDYDKKPSALERYCVTAFVTEYIDTCNVSMTSATSDAIERLCQSYSYPVYNSYGVRYRNLFCALCHGEAAGIAGKCFDGDSDWTYPNLSILTSLQPLYTYETVGPKMCHANQWYDFAVDQCRNVTCHSGRTWLQGEGPGDAQEQFCRDGDENAVNASARLYALSPILTAITNATYVPCLRHWSSLAAAVREHVVSATRKLNMTTYDVAVTEFDHYYGRFEANVRVVVMDVENQTEFELKIIEFFTDYRLPLHGPSIGFSVDFKTNLKPSPPNFIASTPSLSFPDGSCCQQGVDESWDLFDQFFENTQTNLSSDTTVSFSSLTPFARVVLDPSEVEQSPHVGLITLKHPPVSLPSWQTQTNTDGIYVAIPYLERAYADAGLTPERRVVGYHTPRLESILTLCCLVVSIVSLLFLLATYSVFSKLRSLPGVNIMFLAAWLLLAQALLLVVPDKTASRIGCRVLGAALHYAWLCTLCWCSVCSVHMFHVFVTQRDTGTAAHRDRWYLKRYVALAHLVPAAIVGLVLGCTTLSTSGREVGYGGHVCYLNSVVLRGVAFLLPLAVVVATNLVLLIITARTLSDSKQVQNSSPRRSEPRHITIFAKLASLTGLCWLLSVIAEVPGGGWLRYASIVLNGLQGLHLAASYAGNKRVMKMWREAVVRGKRDVSTQSRSTDVTGESVGLRHATTSSSDV